MNPGGQIYSLRKRTVMQVRSAVGCARYRASRLRKRPYCLDEE